MSHGDTAPAPSVPLLNNPKARGLVWQVVLLVALVFLAWSAIDNAATNMRARNIPTNFDFLGNTSGFDVNQTLIDYSAVSTNARAFWVGLLNTLLVAAIGVVFATLIGFLLGVARLSRNYIVAKLAAVYLETVRNVPLLLQLLFWYNAVLKALPELRDSVALPGSIFLNNRGLFMPQPVFGPGVRAALVAFAAGAACAVIYRVWARYHQLQTGRQMPVLWAILAFLVIPPLAAFALAGFPVEFAYPEKGRFNIRGGMEIQPELIALLFGLVIYTAAFIAEVVRAGIVA